MRKHHQNNRTVYVGFLDYRPHVQVEGGTPFRARVITAYVSKTAAKRAYADVRTARLVFDADVKEKR